MIYRGRVSRIIGNDIYVQISALAVDQDFGPMEVITIAPYNVDDYVLVNQIEGVAEDLVIIGLIRENLASVIPGMPLPTQNDSFFGGNSDGTYAWKTKAQTKTALDIQDTYSVSRGGTGITLWTTGNFVRASGATSLEQRTPNQVKSDIGLGNVDNTSDVNKPVSTAQAAAITAGTSGKRNSAPTVFSTAQDFNTITTPGEYIWSAGYGSNTNAPEVNPGILIVFGASATMLHQRFVSYTNDKAYERLYNGTTWTSWNNSLEELPGGVDLNNITASGIYTQSQTVDAASGTNYPIAQAGVLEVMSGTSGVHVWQRYTVYNGGSNALQTFVRAFYTSAWGAWKHEGAKFNDDAACSSTLSLTATNTDVAGCSITVPVGNTSGVYIVTGVFDFQSLGTTATTAVGQLTVGATTYNQQALWNNAALTAMRATVMQQWTVTGLAYGDNVFKLRAMRVGGADAMIRVNVTHTKIVVVQV